jgi:hypothetical protein
VYNLGYLFTGGCGAARLIRVQPICFFFPLSFEVRLLVKLFILEADGAEALS